MKANEFVKKYGWDFATQLSEMSPHRWESSNGDELSTSDLKPYVDAYELVHSYIGRESGQWFFIADYCKKNRNNPFDSESYEKAKNIYLQAVEVVESCK